MPIQAKRHAWLAATVFLALGFVGRPVQGSCQSFDCHFALQATPVHGARRILTETAGSDASEDRLARYSALRTLATESQRVTLLQHDQRWTDTSGVEAALAADTARFESEADALLARWHDENPDDPRSWFAQVEDAASVEARAHLLDEVLLRMPEAPSIDDYPLTRQVAWALRADQRRDESWVLVERYLASNRDHDEAYREFSLIAWHRDDQARREDLVAGWLERLPHSLAAHLQAIEEFEISSRLRAVVEGIPDAITQIEGSAFGKSYLCNDLRWLEGAAHLALSCHLNLAADTDPSDYDDDTRLSFEDFVDVALEQDRWDVIESLIATLPPILSEVARFQAAEMAVQNDDHCRRALALLDGVDFAASRTDAATNGLVDTLSSCGHSNRAPETVASTRPMAEITFAGLSDQQLVATHIYAHHDLFLEELERRLAIDPTNADLHAKLDSHLKRRLRDEKQCQCGRAATLTTWAKALPEDDEPWRRLAKAYQASDKSGPATRALEQAWQRAPDDRSLADDLVNAALASRNLDLAETAGTFLLETADDPKDTAKAHLALFRVAVDRGDGRKDRKAALDHGRAYFPLAIRYQRLPADGPEHAFLALLDREGNHAEIENYVRAKADYLDPQNTASPITRREAVWRLHHLENDPQRNDISRMLGDTWVSLGRPGLALPHYEATADRLPPHPETLVRLARARGATGSDTTAAQAFRDAIALDPSRVLDQARYLADRGDALALEQLEAELVTDDLTLADRVSVLAARALAERGGQDVAQSRLAVVAARSTRAFDAHFELARLYEQKGDVDNALRHYRRYRLAGQRGPHHWPETIAYQERRCWMSQHVNQLIASANAPVTPSRPGH